MSAGNIAAEARNSRSLIFNKSRNHEGNSSSTFRLWRGRIGEECNNMNRTTRNSINAVLSRYNELSSRLDRLNNSINRAELEESRLAARSAKP